MVGKGESEYVYNFRTNKCAAALPTLEGGKWPAAHRVQRGGCPHVWQEPYVQHMQQEFLVLDAIYTVQEEHHGRLVVRHKGC